MFVQWALELSRSVEDLGIIMIDGLTWEELVELRTGKSNRSSTKLKETSNLVTVIKKLNL